MESSGLVLGRELLLLSALDAPFAGHSPLSDAPWNPGRPPTVVAPTSRKRGRWIDLLHAEREADEVTGVANKAD